MKIKLIILINFSLLDQAIRNEEASITAIDDATLDAASMHAKAHSSDVLVSRGMTVAVAELQTSYVFSAF